MKLRIGSTTIIGIASIATGILGRKMGLDLDGSSQVQLILGGLAAVSGRNAVGKVLEQLQTLNGGER